MAGTRRLTNRWEAMNRWLLVQALLWLPLLVSAAITVLGSGPPAWLLGATQVLLLVSFASLWRVLGVGGRVADRVTAARFLGLLAVGIAVAYRGEVGWLAWAAMVLVTLLDLVDGWAARRLGGSDEGAVLDMETDQLATVSFALVAAGVSGAGAWTLILPALRYGFVLGMRALGLPAHDPRPCDGDNRRGKLVCALMMTLLLAAMLPVGPDRARGACTGAAVLALCASYASDAAFLLRRRRTEARPSA